VTHAAVSPLANGTQEYFRPEDAQLANLCSQLLIYDPDERITAREALKHPFFAGFDPNQL